MVSRLGFSCRGCLYELQTGDGYSLKSSDIQKLFSDCVDLQVSTEDGLPQRICVECHRKCSEWQLFRGLCHQSSRLLWTMLGPAPSSSPTDAGVGSAKQSTPAATPPPDPPTKPDLSPESVSPQTTSRTTRFSRKRIQKEVQQEVIGEDLNITLPTAPEKKPRTKEPASRLETAANSHCPVCKVKLPVHERLRDHLRTHLDEDRPSCPLCEERFTRSSRVYAHIMAVHMHEKGPQPDARRSSGEHPHDHTDNGQDDLAAESDEEEEGESQTVEEDVIQIEILSVEEDVFEIHTNQGAKATSDARAKSVEDVVAVRRKGANRHPKSTAAAVEVVKKASFNCPVCGKGFGMKKNMKAHMDLHSEEKQFPCSVCDKAFAKEARLKVHMQLHSKSTDQLAVLTEPTECPACDEVFEGFDSIKTHIFARHATEEIVRARSCTLCDHRIESGLALMEHLFESHMASQIACTNCEYYANTPKAVLEHQTREHAFSREMCPVCGKLVRNIYQHRIVHQPNKAKWDCGECSKKFYSLVDLDRHKLIHTGEKPLACSVCSKRFATKGNLKQHLATHENQNGRMTKRMEIHYMDDEYSCTMCAEKFSNYEPFKNHVFAAHGPEEGASDWDCTTCNEAWETGKGLLDHLFDQHQAGKVLVCVKCEHTEELPSAMEAHLTKIHKARKMCPVCGVRVSDMAYHKKMHQPEENQSRCQVCEKVFFSVSNLMTHMLTHNGEKPFTCRVCHHAFRLERNLATHIQRMHPEAKAD